MSWHKREQEIRCDHPGCSSSTAAVKGRDRMVPPFPWAYDALTNRWHYCGAHAANAMLLGPFTGDENVSYLTHQQASEIDRLRRDLRGSEEARTDAQRDVRELRKDWDDLARKLKTESLLREAAEQVARALRHPSYQRLLDGPAKPRVEAAAELMDSLVREGRFSLTRIPIHSLGGYMVSASELAKLLHDLAATDRRPGRM